MTGFLEKIWVVEQYSGCDRITNGLGEGNWESGYNGTCHGEKIHKK